MRLTRAYYPRNTVAAPTDGRYNAASVDKRPSVRNGMLNLRMILMTVAATAIAVATAGTLVIAQQKNDKPSKEQDGKRPKMTLRLQPQVAIAPARITLTVELSGGSDDFEEYYCPSTEWAWGDDTSSESTTDCEPYEAGKSQIKRRYTTQHQFRRAGTYKVYFHLKLKDRILGSAMATLQVQPGLNSGLDGLQ